MNLKHILILVISLFAHQQSVAQITVFVNGGGFTNPPYDFAMDEAFNSPFNIQAGGSDALDINKTYLFRRANNATSHPFYISDSGAFNAHESILLDGDGTIAGGIAGEESFTLTFETFDPASDTLTFYCTAHSSMVGTFNVIPEPTTYAMITGLFSILLVFSRRKVKG